jgi:hypothetical protein
MWSMMFSQAQPGVHPGQVDAAISVKQRQSSGPWLPDVGDLVSVCGFLSITLSPAQRCPVHLGAGTCLYRRVLEIVVLLWIQWSNHRKSHITVSYGIMRRGVLHLLG